MKTKRYPASWMFPVFLFLVGKIFGFNNVDGINDLFSVFPSNSALQVLSLSVFDRWGNLPYQEDGAKMGWDGTFPGQVGRCGHLYVPVGDAISKWSSGNP